MTPRSPAPLTALPTGASEVTMLLALTVRLTPRHTALEVAGRPLTGLGEAHRWSFPSGTLSSGVLGEVQAVLADLGARELLRALGMVQELPFELLEAYGPF